jgi:Tat protein secretion system quality control protein TatD with DNase activity
MSKYKDLTKKQFLELVKDLCAEESAELLVETGLDYKFDHYDPEVKAVVVKELDTTISPITYESLKPLEKRLQEINSRLVVYILYEAQEEI